MALFAMDFGDFQPVRIFSRIFPVWQGKCLRPLG
jgi:hypothetical protein